MATRLWHLVKADSRKLIVAVIILNCGRADVKAGLGAEALMTGLPQGLQHRIDGSGYLDSGVLLPEPFQEPGLDLERSHQDL